MNGIKDGGPAFPVPDQQHSGGLDGYYGMTLRDYFAAKAMQGLVVNGENINPPILAGYAYELADAMLRAREASNG